MRQKKEVRRGKDGDEGRRLESGGMSHGVEG